MPSLLDYINIRPAPEATGGYNSGLGMTAEEMEAANRAFDFQTAANTWPAQVGPQPGVDLNAAAAALAANDRVSLGESGLPSNIFQGPVSGLGLSTLPANALYNLAAYGLNALGNMGYNQVPLSGLPTGGNVTANMSLAGGQLGGDLSGANVDLSALNASRGGSGLGILGLGAYNPNMSEFDRAALENLVQNSLYRNSVTGPQAQAQENVFPTEQANAQTVTRSGSNLGLGSTTGAVELPPFIENASPMGPTAGISIPSGIGSGLNVDVGNSGSGRTNVPVMEGGTLPTVSVNETTSSTTTPPNLSGRRLSQILIDQYKAAGLNVPAQLPAVEVSTSTTTPTTVTLPVNPNTQINVPYLGPATMGPFAAPTNPPTRTTSSTTQTTATTTTAQTTSTVPDFNVPDLGTLVPTAITPGTGGGRNFAAELAASRAALSNEQQNLMGMYGGIYQNLLGQTAIPEAAQSSLNQMRADQAKLQRIQQGQLAAEDIRQAQQGAREAYAARGQVMGQPAIGAEILNREAIRQQREDQARAGYQASMGNVFNAANLQTGNIFSPIGSLVGQTFNPLGAYPQDVYSSNFNAAQAQQIAAMNNAAAIEAAKYGAQAQRQAATTSGLFNLGARLIPGLFG